MEIILGYHVFNGSQWLQDDEKTWGDYIDAACFTDGRLAQDIGEREAGDTTIYVMACMGTYS